MPSSSSLLCSPSGVLSSTTPHILFECLTPHPTEVMAAPCASEMHFFFSFLKVPRACSLYIFVEGMLGGQDGPKNKVLEF